VGRPSECLIAVFILLGAPVSVLHAQLFVPKIDYYVGSAPYTLVAADFDNDRDCDLATGLSGTPLATDGVGWVSVIMNNGDGTFSSPSTIPVGDEPALAAADLDTNGTIDLVSADFSTHRIYVLLNNGAGGFTVTDSFASGGFNPNELCTPDLDGDGDFDLAVPNFGSNNLAIFFNNGKATFAGPVIYTMGSHPHTAISADLDGDNDSDLVVTNNGSGTVSILLNNGSGGFPSRVDFPVGQNPQTASLADFNGDGCLDLAVPNAGGGTPYVSVLFGNCSGSFDSTKIVPGCRPHTVIPADYDMDEDIDIAVGNAELPCVNVSIHLNNGDGTFAPYFTLEAGHGPHQGVAKDFDADGDVDLAVVNYYDDVVPGNSVSVFMNLTADSVTSVSYESGSPNGYSLLQNYPNPFNPATEIGFQIADFGLVRLLVYDLLGREIAVLVDEQQEPGFYGVRFNASGLASGVYLYRLFAGQHVMTRKMIVLR